MDTNDKLFGIIVKNSLCYCEKVSTTLTIYDIALFDYCQMLILTI